MIRISQTLVTGNGKQTFEKPKTAKSRRLISLTPRAIDALTAHEKRQRATGHYRDDGLIFTARSGGPLDPDNLRRRSFARLLERAGLPSIRFHDLRHTAATILLGSNVHPKIVQSMLGHATIAVTMDTYSHFLPGMHGPATDAMSDALD